MQRVENYGLHWDGPVAWLLQGRGANNFVGLKKQTPFTVAGGMCNHLVPAAAPNPDRIHWQKFLEIFNDPLVQAMLPIPHQSGQNAFYVEDPYNDLALYLSTLSRLSSPIEIVVKPAWNFKVKDLEREMMRSNIQPLVLVQANQKCQEVVDTLGQMSMVCPRTIVVAGGPEVVVSPPMKRIKTNIRDQDLQELMTLPLEGIGATIIRRFARREPIDAPMETRKDRRERQITERTKK